MPSPAISNLSQIPLTCSGHTRPVVQLSFSHIIQQKYYLVSACKDGKPILRDGVTGDWIGTFVGHKGAVSSAMLNGDTTRAVTASADYTARVWNAINGAELVSLAHNQIVRSADFIGHLEDRVVTGCQDKRIRLFDISRPDTPDVMTTCQGPVRFTRWSAYKDLVVSADDKSISLLDTRGAEAVKTLELDEPIANVSLSGKNGRLLVAAAGRRVLVWDLDTFKRAKEFNMSYEVSVATVNPQMNRMVAGGRSDLLVRTYEYERDRELEAYKGHHGPVHDACFSPDGQIYATGSEDGTVRLWQAEPGTPCGLWQNR